MNRKDTLGTQNRVLVLLPHSLQGNFVGPGFKRISPLSTSHWMLKQLRTFVECSALHDKNDFPLPHDLSGPCLHIGRSTNFPQ